MHKILLATIFVSFISQSYGMQQKAISWLPSIARGISTAASVGLPVADYFLEYNDTESERLLHKPDVPVLVQAWVDDTSRECGFNQKVYAKVSNHTSWTATDIKQYNIVNIPAKDVKKLDERLTSGATNDAFVAYCRSNFTHECSHLMHKDSQTRHKVGIFTAFMSSVVIHKAINAGRVYVLPQYGLINALGATALYLGSIVPNLTAMRYVEACYQHYAEKRADAFGFEQAKTKQELEESIDYFKWQWTALKDNLDHPEISPLMLKKKNLARRYACVHFLYGLSVSEKSFGDWIEQYPSAINFIHWANENEHPSPFSRMQAAQKALEKFRDKIE